VGNDYEFGFDIGPWKDAATVALLLEPTAPDLDDDAEQDVEMEIDNDSVYSESEGSEVEVPGGVTLTEEAVETHTPDILNLPVSPIVADGSGAAKGAHGVEGEDEDGDAEMGGMDMGSIITQV
jgi:hypothetical protein